MKTNIREVILQIKQTKKGSPEYIKLIDILLDLEYKLLDEQKLLYDKTLEEFLKNN